MSSSKPISLDKFREKKQKELDEQPIPGRLVWLRCPKCKTMEYTEIIAPTGRTHKCGTQVKEAEVELDLRAEYTITVINLRRIEILLEKNKAPKLFKLISKSLDNALLKLRQSERIYQERLLLAAGRDISPYPDTVVEQKERLPVREVNKLGLLVSDFRFEPEKRFPSLKKI